MTKEAKTTRNLKVIEQSGYRYQATPTVMLKGKWLSEFGFDIGTHVKVECEDGRLIITPDTERAALAKAEQEFMEREMASLNKRFQKEKERLHAQFVQKKICTRKMCIMAGFEGFIITGSRSLKRRNNGIE